MRSRNRLGMLGVSALAVVLIHIIGAGDVFAQRWQATYGTANCAEASHRGTTGVSTGGYITAGGSNSPLPACAVQNVYVVRTDDGGNLLWSYTYNVGGGNSAATCIRECANGDFIVAGVCANQSACCCNPNDIFLMRLDQVGGVRWVKSYGSAGSEYPNSLIEATVGNGVSTKPGDFVVCGNSGVNGYIFRASAGGNLIWDQTYSGSTPGQSLTYLDIDEATQSQPGSIIAVGQLGAPGNPATLIRVKGDDGSIATLPVKFTLTQASAGYSVKELQVTNPGDIVVTGYVTVGIKKVFIARFASTLACGSNALASRVYTNLAGVASGGFDIQEMGSGNLVVTGYATSYPNGFGSNDVMLMEVDPTTLTYVGSKFNLFGGSGDDDGYAVAENSQSAPTFGFIISGITNSFGLADYDIYMIKTSTAGSSFCNSINLSDPSTTLAIQLQCYTPTLAPINLWCTPPYTLDQQTWQNPLCYMNPAAHHDENPSDGTARVPEGKDDPAIPLTNNASMESYPNPVRRGSTFKLDYSVAHAGRVTIDVVDVAGKTVYSRSENLEAGSNQIPVGTDGWPNGAYLIRLSADGATATQRVMVVDK